MAITTANIGDRVKDDHGNVGDIVGVAGDRVEWQDIPDGLMVVDTEPRGYWIVPMKYLDKVD